MAALIGNRRNRDELTIRPVQRRLPARGIKIDFMVKSNIPAAGLIQEKNLSGQGPAASRELTATDLLMDVNRIAGINRVATMLREFGEGLDAAKFRDIINESIPIVRFQRLGYLMEYELKFKSRAGILCGIVQGKIKRHNLLFTARKGNPRKSGNRAKIRVNTQIELDF